MGNKRRPPRRKQKNRGGEKLKEWRVLHEFGIVQKKNIDNVGQSADEEMNFEGEVPADLVVESSSPVVVSDPFQITGRRIVDIRYFFDELVKLSEHSPQFGCTLKNMKLVKEIKRGLRSGFVFKCDMCCTKQTVWSEAKPSDTSTTMDVNSAAVAGSISNGGGFTALERMLCTMDIRCMSRRTYDQHDAIVSKGWEETATLEMKEAAEEEIRLAVERGDVNKEGVPLLTVVADGSWAKRSYRTNYNSLSGMAAIVGYHTRKVLYFGVKNKYCVTCARLSSKTPVDESNPAPSKPTHVCFKNWNGSSSSMEAATIVEGFLSSEEMYGVQYARMIADGDSSVYNSVLEARPYKNLTVVKIECRNHMLRNYCNKLKDVATTSLRKEIQNVDRGLHLKMRRIVAGRIIRLRTAVTGAIQHRKHENGRSINEKAEKLRLGIVNGPSHVFGEHLHCKERNYFCTGPKQGETNHIPDLKSTGLYYKIMEAVNVLADHSSHLIHDVDSNMVEHYNSVIARFTGGKRINYIQKGSYQTRCAAAVVSHNTGTGFYKLHKTILNNSPGTYSKRYELKNKRLSTKRAERMKSKPKARRRLKMTPKSSTADKHYGPFAKKPDMDPELYELKAKEHMESLKKTSEEVAQIELNTRDQSDSQMWFEERRIRLTASNFGLVCNRRPDSNCAPVVNKLLYTSIHTHSLNYGKDHEKDALLQLQNSLGISVQPCGFFVDKNQPFLGASPDGLVGTDGIVEVKCPSSGEELTPEEVIERKVGLIGSLYKRDKNGSLSIKPNHPYYYQVQGQLHITGRDYCILTLWTPKGIKTENIVRDDAFWEASMRDKLERFYMTCLLPEIIDPRKRRSLPIREPDYILSAKLKKKDKKTPTQPVQ